MDTRPWHRFYDEGVPASLEYPDITLVDMLHESTAKHGQRPALRFMNGRLTYREFNEHVDRLATALAALGVEKDTRVAIQLPNLPQGVIGCFAVLRLGAHVVMTNPLYTSREIVDQWNDAGVTVAIVMDFLFERRVKPVRDQLQVKHFVIASIPDYLRFPLNLLAPLKLKRHDPPMIAAVTPEPGVHRFTTLIRDTAPNPPAVTITPDDVAMLQYTGGTTGVSKGAMLTHRNLCTNVEQVSTWTTTPIEPGKEVMVSVLPHFHIFGLTIAMFLPIRWAGLLVLVPNPRDIPGIVKAVVKHGATVLPAVPAIYNAICEHPGVERLDLSSVKACVSGSAPLPVDVLHRFEKLTGARITEGFGLTETSPVTHANPLLGTRKVGSIGVPYPDTDSKIVDLEDGITEMPTGREGELILKGPQVMLGYWNKPDETACAIRDGWFYTGDIAVMDEDGFHFIVGRKKDMILCSGYNVYPDEIDRVLASHPAVLEAASIGVPDPKRGETVKSFVVLRPGESCSAADLTVFCREQLAAYKVPTAIEFRDELPKSSVLKVLRRELRDQELAKTAPA